MRPGQVYVAETLPYDEYDLLLQGGFDDVAGLPEAYEADGQWAAGAYVLDDGRTVLVGYLRDRAVVVGP
jgi:hypothetical protein